MRALDSGLIGSYECLAQQAGVAANEARYTLHNLKREGLAVKVDRQPLGTGAGRPRTVFARAPDGGAEVFDSLATLQRLWR